MEKSILKQKRKLGFSLGLLLITSQVIFTVIELLMEWLNIEESITVTYLLNAFSIYVVGFLAIKLLLRKVENAEPKPKVKQGAKRVIWYLFIALGLGIFCSTLTNEITTLIAAPFGGEITDRVSDIMSESTPILLLLFVAVIGPIFEELIFRGLLLKKLRVYGDKTAIIYTAIIFGLFHTNIAQILFAGVIGAVLAYVVIKSNNIKYSIIIHILINLSSSVVTILEICGLDTLQTIVAVVLTIIAIAAIIVVPLKGAKYKLDVSNESKYEKKKLYNNIGYITSCLVVVLITLLSAIA